MPSSPASPTFTCGKLTDYVGNYSKYVEQRDAMLERLRQAKREQDEESRA